MSYSYGRDSRVQLATCHPDLRAIFRKAITLHDIKIIKGLRGKAEQNKAFKDGFSKLKWPDGKHNAVGPDGNEDPTALSHAVDAAPWPLQNKFWEKDPRQLYYFGGFIKGIALDMRIPLRWGGDWNSNLIFTDQTFDDLFHFELIL